MSAGTLFALKWFFSQLADFSINATTTNSFLIDLTTINKQMRINNKSLIFRMIDRTIGVGFDRIRYRIINYLFSNNVQEINVSLSCAHHLMRHVSIGEFL